LTGESKNGLDGIAANAERGSNMRSNIIGITVFFIGRPEVRINKSRITAFLIKNYFSGNNRGCILMTKNNRNH
jgi:hypothetical protein